MATSASQNTITATWTEDRTVVTAINGDPCVVVGAGITGLAFTPAYVSTPGSERHGAVNNTTSGIQHPFDGRGERHNASLAYTGTSPVVGDTILKAYSTATPSVAGGYDSDNRSYLDYAMVLSFIDADPGEPFFRPAYAGTTKVIHLVSEVDESKLPTPLAKASVANAPANLDDLVARFERVQVDHIYNAPGQEIRPKNHMAPYGGDIATKVSEALLAMCLDYTIEQKRPLMYGLIQYGIDLYYAMKQGNTVWTGNGGHDHARKAVMVFTAIMLDNATMKTDIKAWSTGDDLKFYEDEFYQYSDVAKTTLYGGDGTEAAYLAVLASGSGNKAIRDPYGWIDGGVNPGYSYQEIVDPYFISVAMLADRFSEWEEIWNSPSAKVGHRITEFGRWTLPDPYAADGTIDCTGRFVIRHGDKNLNSAYTSAFMQGFQAQHFTTDHLFPPVFGPFSPSEAAASHEITLTAFGYVDPGGSCGTYRADAGAAIPADGVFPYISSGVTFKYSINGGAPQTYSGAFTVDADDADGNGNVNVRAWAEHASYEDSPSVFSTYKIANFVRQAKSARNDDSGGASVSVAFDSAPLAGSVIIAQASVRSIAATIAFSDNEVAGSAWNSIYTSSTHAPSGQFSWKVANGSIEDPDPFTVTATPSGSQRQQISIMEVLNLDTSGLEGSAFTLPGGVSPTNTRTSGTTSSLPAGNYFAVAAFPGDDNGTVPNVSGFSNGFSEEAGASTFSAGTNRARGTMATKVISAAGTVETTLTLSAATWRGSGGVAVFNVLDTTPPTLLGASINSAGDELELTFSEPMDTDGTDGFGIMGSGNNNISRALSNPVWSGGNTVLTFDIDETVFAEELDDGVPTNDIILSYTAGDAADAAGNSLANIGGVTVSNGSEIVLEQGTMGEWHVNFETGNDVYGFGTEANPRKTFPPNASINNGDRIYLKGERWNTFTLPGDYVIQMSGKSSVIIESELSLVDPADWATIRGDVDISEGENPGGPIIAWTNPSGNRWIATIGTLSHPPVYTGSGDAAGKQVGATWNYDASVTAEGYHYGHLKQVADSSTCESTNWSFYWDDTNKVMHINLAGADPTGGVVTVVNCNDANLINLENCTNCVVRRLHFKCAPVWESGYGVIDGGGTSNHHSDLWCEDIGTHAVGIHDPVEGAAARCDNIFGSGMTATGSWYVYYTSSTTPISGARGSFGDWKPRTWLLGDQTPVGVLAGQGALYAHSNGPTVVNDIEFDGGTLDPDMTFFVNGATSAYFVNAANVPAPSDPNDWRTYPVRIKNVTIEDWGIMGFGGGTYIGLKDCTIKVNGLYGCPTTNNVDGMIRFTGSATSTGKVCFETCIFLPDFTTSATNQTIFLFSRISSTSPDQQFIFINPTMINTTVQAYANIRGFFNYKANQKHYIVRGGLIGHLTSNTAAALCWNDSTVSAANHDILDCRYLNIDPSSSGGRYSLNGALNSVTDWMTNVDTLGAALGSSPFVGAGDYGISESSDLFDDDKSERTTLLPENGINGLRYDGTYGAYQYGITQGYYSGYYY